MTNHPFLPITLRTLIYLTSGARKWVVSLKMTPGSSFCHAHRCLNPASHIYSICPCGLVANDTWGKGDPQLVPKQGMPVFVSIPHMAFSPQHLTWGSLSPFLSLLYFWFAPSWGTAYSLRPTEAFWLRWLPNVGQRSSYPLARPWQLNSV